MNKYFHHTAVVLLFAAAIFFSACSKEEVDNQKPVIEIEEPLDHAHFHPGDIIHFDAEFSDNVALSQFKIDIHYGGDHGHKNSATTLKWSYEYIGELSGRNKHIHMDIPVPAHAQAGEYHFLVYCTDKAGNEAFVALEIEIEDHNPKK